MLAPDPALVWLAAADQETVLRAVAHWLARFDATDLEGWKAIEREWVATTILEPLRGRLLGLLQGSWTLVTPQSLLIAAKRAIVRNGPSGERTDHQLFMAAVAIQDGLGRKRVPGETAELHRRRLVAEVLANQAFHEHPDPGYRAAQSELRWREIPRRADLTLAVDVADVFGAVSGVPLLDVQSLAFGLFSKVLEEPGGSPQVGPLAASIGWERDRVEAVLRLIAATPAAMAPEIQREERAFGENWSFDALRRYPVARLADDRILVLSPRLLIERAFGWLPFFDMTQPDHSTPDIRLTVAQAKNAFEMIAEREIVDSLEANVRDGRKRGRLFDGATLRGTYPDGRIADAAIAYGDAFVVVEVTTARLKRDVVVGMRLDALDDDVARVIVEEVDQIEGTIRQLLADSERLTGDGRQRRRIVPVLVVAEGIPVNELTLPLILDRIAEKGLLAGPGVETLRVLSTEDVYAAEIMAQTDTLGLLEVLDLHWRSGAMRDVDLRSWLIVSNRLRQRRPDRLDAPMATGLDRLVRNLGFDPYEVY